MTRGIMMTDDDYGCDMTMCFSLRVDCRWRLVRGNGVVDGKITHAVADWIEYDFAERMQPRILPATHGRGGPVRALLM